MSGGAEDRIDGVAFAASELIAFKMTIVLEMTDDGFDPVSSSHFTANGG